MAEKPLLLVVDDDPRISDALGFAFASEFDVIASHSRHHCLRLLQQLRQAPQIALVDLGLPPLPHRPDEGFALISDLLAACPDVKIIVLTGQNDEDNARHARTLGAVDFVGKPCYPGLLLKLLHQAMAFGATSTPDSTHGGLIGSLPIQRLRLQLGQHVKQKGRPSRDKKQCAKDENPSSDSKWMPHFSANTHFSLAERGQEHPER